MSLTSSPKLIKGGLVVLAPGGGAVRNTIALQYNPDTLTRSYQVQGVGGDGGGERAQPFRLKGPAIEIDQARRRDRRHRPARISRQQRQRRGLRHRAADRGCSRRWSIRASTSCSPSRRRRQTARWRSCRPRRRWCCSSGARTASCRCASPSSRSPRRRSIRRSIRSAPRSASACACMSTDDLGFTHKGGTMFLSYLRAREALAAQGRHGDAGRRSASPTCRDGDAR